MGEKRGFGMSETKGALNMDEQMNLKPYMRLAWFIAILTIAILIIVRYLEVFGNVLIVAIGFGAVVMIHELGHFIAAKLSGIKVEAFSIGFPPIVLGIKRVENGWQVRILPEILKKEGQEEGQFGFTIPAACKAGETEYRIGLIPFGGFVKMLGQEDIGAVKSSDDPRSYANKSVGTRMAVITAGVTFNVISALIVFIAVFLIGIEWQPPIIGDVIPDSPAARAGLRAGDEIIAIGGKTKNLDFSDIKMAAVLSKPGQAVAMEVKHPDGSVGKYELVAEELPGEKMKGFGIYVPRTLKIAKVSGAEVMYDELGLLPEDKVVAVNGKAVENYGQLEDIVKNTFAPAVTVEVERKDTATGKIVRVEAKIPLSLSAAKKEIEGKYDLSQICSMVPRLRVAGVLNEKSNGPKLNTGDIILAAGGVENPTYQEFREVTTAHKDKPMEVRVLRTEPNGVEKAVTITVVPKENKVEKQVMVGIAVSLDAAHPVVAKTINAEGGVKALAIPRRATVTAVNGAPVSSFYDIIREIERNKGKQIAISYCVDNQTTGNVTADTKNVENLVTVESVFAKPVPFDELKKLYKASGPIAAMEMGYKKTIGFIANTYITLKRLVSGLVSPKELMGPVGIVTVSYRIVAQEPLIYYVYFLGLISAAIAVFNFLPLPPLDGGLIVLLTIEKIKGSALSERTMEIIAYAGWALIGTFFLYLTFNDVVRSFFSG